LRQNVSNKKKTDEFIGKIKNQEINTTVKKVKQQEHIQGTKKWAQRVKENLKNKGTAPDMFLKDIDVQKLVDDSKGSGIFEFRKNQEYPIEYVSSEKVIGKAFNPMTKKYEDTKRFAIRYSSKGVHAHPVYERSW